MPQDPDDYAKTFYKETVSAYAYNVARLTRASIVLHPHNYHGHIDWPKSDQEWRERQLKILDKLRIAVGCDSQSHSANLSKAYLEADRELDRVETCEREELEKIQEKIVDDFEAKRFERIDAVEGAQHS